MSDFSIVEDRFHEILKQRLTKEIETNPPLFPWENEIVEYPMDIYDDIAKVNSWFPELPLPIQLPLKVFSNLLESCLNTIDSFDPQPAKMVKVVSQLFPNNLQFLNNEAGKIAIAGVTRGAATLEKVQDLDLEDYDHCSLEQKMTISLLVAQQILNNLIINLSQAQSSLEKEWEINAGKIAVKANYLIDSTQIEITVKLPEAGEISWYEDEQIKTINCDSSKTFYFNNIESEKIYYVNITLCSSTQTALKFGIKIT